MPQEDATTSHPGGDGTGKCFFLIEKGLRKALAIRQKCKRVQHTFDRVN